ncbi:MAG: G3E family GTPase [Verrucomicrobiales bacterium]|jgi:G3E family GTPase
MLERPRYIMIGGFLGAGKTTSIQAFAQHLDQQGVRVGLITNDQGAGLVDSAIGRSKKFPVEEISGGCFCCKFDSLVDAARHLSEDAEVQRPDVFLAEPVGSCTDLVATVGLPLQSIYGNDFVVAPLSVLVDPVRALRVFQLEEGKGFSENVCYIYKKQLQEAGTIVINKVDLISAEQLQKLRAHFAVEFPDAQVMEVSARGGDGLVPWFKSMLEGEMDAAKVLDIDYEQYADGEALLGWLNATVRIKADDEVDGNQLLLELAGALRIAMDERGFEVAHLKATISPEDAPSEIAAVSLVRSETQPELSHRLVEPLEEATLLLNIRAEAPPEDLEQATQAALAGLVGVKVEIKRLEHFRPGKPEPTHRYST